MTLTPLTVHRLAVVGAAALSGLALFDAFTKATTGHLSVFSDDSDVRWMQVLADLIHGAAYVGMVAVLLQHRQRIATANRVARWAWWVLIASLTVLAAAFLLLAPFVDRASLPAAASAPIGISFALMLVSGPVLGLAVLRVAGFRPGSLLLAAMPLVLGVTLVLGAVAPRLAHPAYLEVALGFGVALLGYRFARQEVLTGATPAEAAAGLR